MFARLASFVSRYWLLVLVAWVAVPLGVKFVAPNWDDVTHDGDFAYLPKQMTSARGEVLLAQAFPNIESKSQIVLIAARHDRALGEADYAVVDRLAKKFRPRKADEEVPAAQADEEIGPPLTDADRKVIASTWCYTEDVVGKKLVSPDGRAALVTIQLRNEFMALSNKDLLRNVYATLDALRSRGDFPSNLRVEATGSAGIGGDMLMSAEESIENTEIATVVLVVLILLIVYRAPGLVVVPLVAIVVSMTLSMDVIAMLAQWSERAQTSVHFQWFDFRIFKTTKIFIVVMLYGAATDYCLFLISRYREELQKGLTPKEAIEEAVSQTGHAVAASAMTAILGLGTMIFADFGKFRYGGPTIALCLTVALVSCLTLAPALLRAGGRWVFWPFRVGPAKAAAAPDAESASPQGVMGRFWEWLSRALIARPGLIFVGCLLVLAVPAYQAKNVEMTYNLVGELSPQRPSVRGIRLLQQHFPPGETGPITILVHREQGTLDDVPGRAQIADLTRELGGLNYADDAGRQIRPILEVRSLTNPLGDPPKGSRGMRDYAMMNNPRVRGIYMAQAPGYAGKVTRLDLICKYDPFSQESVTLFEEIEKWLLAKSADANSPWHGTEFDFIGITAGIRDLKAVNTSDYWRTGILASLAVLAVLVFLLRRVWISIYLVLTVLLGYFVTLGVTKVLFAAIYGDTFHGLDWKLPIFLFVILVAVGEDYNIYLATRIFEEQRRRGALEGLRVAVVRTGGIITSCGVIMAGTFASMLTGTLRGMYEMGFALAFGVLLDTFVIRTVLVPAFLALWAAGSRIARKPRPPRRPKRLRATLGLNCRQ